MSDPAGNGSSLPYWVAGGCVIVRVRLTPKSSLDAIGKIVPTVYGPAVGARVRAAPESGAANKAARRLFARWLDVPISRVRLTSGSKSRVKSFEIMDDPVFIGKQIAARLK